MGPENHLVKGQITAPSPDIQLDDLRVELWQRDWPARVIPVDVPYDYLDVLPTQLRRRLGEQHLATAIVDENGVFTTSTAHDIKAGIPLFYRLFSSDRYLGSGEVTPTPMAESPGTLSVELHALEESNRWPVPPAAIGAAVILTGAIAVGWWALGRDSGDDIDDRSSEPEGFAPPLDRTVAAGLGESTRFLYTGDDPVQKGVKPDTIKIERVAVLRGRVTNHEETPVTGVRISIVDHPEYGWTTTREGGIFDMAVNGGGRLTLRYEHEEYHVAQRSVHPPIQQFTWAPKVVVTPDRSEPTEIETNADGVQVATGAEIEDDAGTRQPTVFVPPGTGATVATGDDEQSPQQLSLQITEYTVGSQGPAAMPDQLPPTSGYTYAVEIGATGANISGSTATENQISGANAFRARPFLPPEAVDSGPANLASIGFDQPILHYVENFLDFPVGGLVPSGYYDYSTGGWVAAENGRVIEIVGTSGNLAQIDVTGDGQASAEQQLSEVGITEEERRELARRYEGGTTLWRVPLPHLTPWDHNWPFGPPQDAKPPDIRLAKPPTNINSPCTTQ